METGGRKDEEVMFDFPSLVSCDVRPIIISCEEDDRNDWMEDAQKGAERAMMEKREALVKEAIGRATGRSGGRDIVLQEFGGRLVTVKLAHKDVDRYMLDGVGLIEFYPTDFHVSRQGLKVIIKEKYKMLV